MPYTYAQIIQEIGKNYRIQPIMSRFSREIIAVELLSKKIINLQDMDYMLRQDIAALHAASLLSRALLMRIHCNAEIYSMMHPKWIETLFNVQLDGVVIEIVERNHLLQNDMIFRRIAQTIKTIKSAGGRIALDDVTVTELEKKEIKAFQPEYIKIENIDHAPKILELSSAKIIIERIETEKMLRALGRVNYLQGYWCDVVCANRLPIELELPGVSALKNNVNR